MDTDIENDCIPTFGSNLQSDNAGDSTDTDADSVVSTDEENLKPSVPVDCFVDNTQNNLPPAPKRSEQTAVKRSCSCCINDASVDKGQHPKIPKK